MEGAIIMTVLSIACTVFILGAVIFSVSTALYYRALYSNLHRNFKQYISETERHNIKVDVILHNAVLEALEQAEEKGNNFEIKAYTDLLNRLKGKW